MKKLVKFKTVEVVKEVELEIDLPAYFILGIGKPSDGGHFNIVKVTDPEKRAEKIESPFDSITSHFAYGSSAWEVDEIAADNRFTQVDESEWGIAVDMLIKSIK